MIVPVCQHWPFNSGSRDLLLCTHFEALLNNLIEFNMITSNNLVYLNIKINLTIHYHTHKENNQ